MEMQSICPIDLEAQTKQPCHTTNPGIATCEVCGSAMCPVCFRHNVQQLSRVTGYIGAVGGWNEGKKQELRDRIRHDIGKAMV